MGIHLVGLLNKIGIQLDCYTLSPINSTSTAHLFYPIQTCSNMCGVKSIVHGSSNVWCMELGWSQSNAPNILSKPSSYSQNL